jgi:V/A-type H+-transporting ATPase subunit I
MRRVAIVAPERRWRSVLVAVADAGVVEPAAIPAAGPTNPAREALVTPRLRPVRPDPEELDELERTGHTDLVAGERELDRVTGAAVQRDGVRALTGWTPADRVCPLRERLAPLGGSVVELSFPVGADVPTVLPDRHSSAALRPLVDTYATVPYRNVDPVWFATAAYVVMFGMMFGDVGDGLVLVLAALLVRRSTNARLAFARRVWPLIIALGTAAALFGLLYGEAFGPTGLVPTLWLAPLDEPERLLLAGVAVGAVLLAVAFVIGIVNRWREAGPRGALWSTTGLAGAALFLGVALVAGGVSWSVGPLWVGGAVLAGLGLLMAAVGLRSEAGPGGAGAIQAGVETFDLTVRLGSNIVSFARLAAFGLMHAAIASVVWDATTALWGRGIAAAASAVIVFVAGHAVAFALESLVAAVQALRLEYYELFSRIFVREGRPFRPWHVPVDTEEA